MQVSMAKEQADRQFLVAYVCVSGATMTRVWRRIQIDGSNPSITRIYPAQYR
jgi:hypothetical protein